MLKKIVGKGKWAYGASVFLDKQILMDKVPVVCGLCVAKQQQVAVVGLLDGAEHTETPHLYDAGMVDGEMIHCRQMAGRDRERKKKQGIKGGALTGG